MTLESNSRRPVVRLGAGASKGRILIVDDQPQIRRVLRTALVAKGYEVDDATGGEEAFEKFRNAMKAILTVPKSALPPSPFKKWKPKKRRAKKFNLKGF